MARTTPATQVLDRAGIHYQRITYTLPDHFDSYGEAVIAAIGQSPRQVFKTLMVGHDKLLVSAMIPVAAQLDLKAIAALLQLKNVQLAPPAQAERITGYKVGGICALGQRQTHKALIDTSALAFDRIFISGGQRGLELGLAPQDLISISDAEVATIARF